MKPCCQKEARLSLSKHRDIATCDECGALLLAYGNDVDYQRTLAELAEHGVETETEIQGALRIVAKPRA